MSGAIGIVVAAGTSTRFGGPVPKQFLDLGGRTIAERAVRGLAAGAGIDGIVVVLPPAEIGGSHDQMLRGIPGVTAVVQGGATRAASSLAGVEAAEGASLVLVHDAARPFVTAALVEAVLRATVRYGAAVPALPARDTIKRSDGNGFVTETLDRAVLHQAQTPQGARRDWMLEALRKAVADGDAVTDEAQALERAGRKVALVEGDPSNMKITTTQDWSEALRRVDAGGTALRVGHGFDVHRYGGARELVLGGISFPGEPGLLGHSDADVVLHAAMDALLGACALPDIGHYFPSDDPRFDGADSVALGREVLEHVRHAGFEIVNLDLTILAERPRIAERADAMRGVVASCFSIERDRVGLKATTLEGLGALGRGEGIACHAVALVARLGGRG